MEFPDKLYTAEDVKKARILISKGYRHSLTIQGSPAFAAKVQLALELVRVAGYYDFLITYIRCIEEIDGLTQLHETDATIWSNRYAVENPVDAASVFVQKTHTMKEYIDGRLYYGGEAEKRSVEKRKEFLETLRRNTKEKETTDECDRLLKMWSESSLVY